MSTSTALPTRTPSRKVVAATGGGLLGVPTADLVLYFISKLFYDGGPLPLPLDTWLGIAVPALLVLVAGYLMPRGLEEVEGDTHMHFEGARQ